MLRVIWFVILVFLISTCFIWLADSKGSVDINWLGYRLVTDITTFCILIIFASVLIFSVSYLFLEIISLKSRFFDFFKNPLKKREKLIQRYKKTLDLFIDASIALNSGDLKGATKLESKINSLVKNPRLKKLLAAQVFYLKGDLKKASQLFSEFNGKNAEILSLKSKLEYLLNEYEDAKAIVVAEQILNLREDDKKTSALLFNLYKKQGDWQNAKNLIEKDGVVENNHDLTIINAAIAKRFYLDKNYREAIRHAKTALIQTSNFLPALLILVKSYIKSGLVFLAILKIRSSWKLHPALPMATIYNFIYRKASKRRRLGMMRKLYNINPRDYLSNLAFASLAINLKDYPEAKTQLDLALIKNKTSKVYKLISALKLRQGNQLEAKEYLGKSLTMTKDQIWQCKKCHDYSQDWNARCTSCRSYDSLIWQE